MSKAGDNEKKFRALISKQFGVDCLSGSQTYKKGNANVSISVDDMIEYGNKKLLFEIDSGNYAKLIVGQYVLLNTIIDKPENIQFVVVHYYQNYNVTRTYNNLQFINDSLFESKGIPFKVFTAESYKAEIEKYTDISSYIDAQF